MAKMRKAYLKNYILPEFGDEVLDETIATNTKLFAVNVEKWLAESRFPDDHSLIFYGVDEVTPLPRDRIADVLEQRLKLLPQRPSCNYIR